MKETFKTLVWNLYRDQVQKINLEISDGKSFSEYIRRIIDDSIKKEAHTKFINKADDTRILEKVTIRVTKRQFDYLNKEFPNRKNAKGLRFLIDYFLNLKEEK